MKASSVYRTQIIRETLTDDIGRTLDKLAAAVPYAQGPMTAQDLQNKIAALRPLLDRLDEIHKMLTEKR